MNILDLLLKLRAVGSKSEGRRVLAQGGVWLDGERIGLRDDFSVDLMVDVALNKCSVLKVGKRKQFFLGGKPKTEDEE